MYCGSGENPFREGIHQTSPIVSIDSQS